MITNSVLQFAFYLIQGHMSIVQLLIKYKADVHLCDNDGNTAVHRAIQLGHSDIAQLLLEHDDN